MTNADLTAPNTTHLPLTAQFSERPVDASACNQAADSNDVSTLHPTLVKLHARVAEFGWRCLSREWINYRARYEFACANGHRVTRPLAYVMHRQRVLECAECVADEVKARCLAFIAQRGGTLLDSFKGLNERVRLRCVQGHEWTSTGRNLSIGHWCRECHHEKLKLHLMHSDGLQQIQAAALDKGGRCLAEEYRGMDARYPFECAQGHRWEAQAGIVVYGGRWCHVCSLGHRSQLLAKRYHPDGLRSLHEAAQRHGGECLATDYTRANERYAFRCARGHEWKAQATNVWSGQWCRRCANLALRAPIESCHAVAASRGGKCLSSEYSGAHHKLDWECHLGHVWPATPNAVKNGSWCPNCARLNQTRNHAKRKRYGLEG